MPTYNGEGRVTGGGGVVNHVVFGGNGEVSVFTIRSHLKFISFLLLFLSFSYRDDILVFLPAMFKKISKKISAKENDVDTMLKFG